MPPTPAARLICRRIPRRTAGPPGWRSATRRTASANRASPARIAVSSPKSRWHVGRPRRRSSSSIAGRSSWISEYVCTSSMAAAAGSSASRRPAEALARGQRQHRADALAARQQRVAHRVHEPARRGRAGVVAAPGRGEVEALEVALDQLAQVLGVGRRGLRAGGRGMLPAPRAVYRRPGARADPPRRRGPPARGRARPAARAGGGGGAGAGRPHLRHRRQDAARGGAPGPRAAAGAAGARGGRRRRGGGRGRRGDRRPAIAWWWPTRRRAARAPTAGPARPTCARASSTSPAPSPSGCASRPRSSPATCTRCPRAWRPRRPPSPSRSPAPCTRCSAAARGATARRSCWEGGSRASSSPTCSRAAATGCTWPTRTRTGAPARWRGVPGPCTTRPATRRPRGPWPPGWGAAGAPTWWSRPSAGPPPGAWRWSSCVPGGLVLLHGGCPVGSVVELPTERIHYSEITLRGSFHHTPRVFAQALAMIAAGDVNVAEFLGPPIGLDEVGPALTSSPGVKHPVRM